MKRLKKASSQFFPFIFIFFVFITALICTHIRVKTILIGYEIGKLKSKESFLLKSRSLLTMELAKLTTKKNLQALLKQESKKL